MERSDRLVLALFVLVVLAVATAVTLVILIKTGHWIGDPCHDSACTE